MKQYKVIITDVRYRMSIAPIRELAKKGYRIVAADFKTVPKRLRLGCYSRYAKIRGELSDRQSEFADDVISLCDSGNTVLLPVNRTSLVNVIKNRSVLEKHCFFTVPDIDALNTADDKRTMSLVAKKIGVPIPHTVSLSEYGNLDDLEKSVSYPCIIKYRNGEAMGLKPAQRYSIVNNRGEFIREYTRMNALDSNPICSDYIPGHDIGVAVVMNSECKPVDFLCYESLSEYPLEGGPTCFVRTIFNRNLLKYAVSLLEEIKFSGIAMLDFRGSAENAYFLEINPRVWGSAAITEVSKSSFFESYVKSSLGQAKEIDIGTCTPNYNIGTKMRFTPQSFACFKANMKKSDNKAETVKNYVKSFFDFSVKDGLFSFGDMKPYIMYIANLFKRF